MFDQTDFLMILFFRDH